MASRDARPAEPSARGFAVSLLRRLVAAIAAHWPELLAIELVSRIVATLLVGVAGLVGASSAVGGLALAALVALVNLTAMLLQLLVLLATLESAPLGEHPTGRWHRVARGLGASMLPAFVLLMAWGVFQDDLATYTLAALEHVDWFDDGLGAGTVLDVQVDVFTISLLVVCLVVRGVLRRFERNGKRGIAPLALLVEGLWVFLAVQVLGTVLGWGLEWLDGTRPASWTDAAATALHGIVGDWPADVLGWLGGVWHDATVPIMWVALATIVLAGSRPGLAEPPAPTRVGTWLRARIDALPSPIDDVLEEVTDDLQDRWLPVGEAVRGVARAGVVPLAIVVLAWYVLETASGWLTVGLAHVSGPEPQSLAEITAAIGSLVGSSVQDVLELTLAVAALDALRIAAGARGGTASRPGAPHGESGIVTASSPTTSSSRGSVTPSGTTKPMDPETGSPAVQ